MLRLNDRKLEEAWGDLLSCHRLARLAGQGPMMVDADIAFSKEESVCAGDQAVLQNTHLTAIQAATMREDLNRLSPMPKMADKLDVEERFMYLNIVSDFSRQGFASLAGFDTAAKLKGLNIDDALKSLIHYGANTTIDSDLVLRRGNSWYDRIADACRKPTRAERREALRRLDRDLRRLYKTAADAKSLDKSMLANPRQALSERFSEVLLTVLLPEITFLQSEDRGTMRFELDKLGFALASYRADRSALSGKARRPDAALRCGSAQGHLQRLRVALSARRQGLSAL